VIRTGVMRLAVPQNGGTLIKCPAHDMIEGSSEFSEGSSFSLFSNV